MNIPFTQFVPPNGRRVACTIDRPEPIALKAKDLLALGYRFETELLSVGVVSMTVEYPEGHELAGEEAFVHRLVPNGPTVPDEVDAMILEAHERVSTVSA